MEKMPVLLMILVGRVLFDVLLNSKILVICCIFGIFCVFYRVVKMPSAFGVFSLKLKQANCTAYKSETVYHTSHRQRNVYNDYVYGS